MLEYNSGKLPEKNAGLECNSAKLPQRKCCWMQHPQSALGRNVWMTLTQGHNFDFGFLTQRNIWFLTQGRFYYFFEFWWWLKVKSWFSTKSRILILLMMTQGQDSFTFGFQWMTLGQEFHLLLFFFVQFKFKV